MSADREDPEFATRGLEQRFEVTRLTPSTRGIDHSECRYFVLDPQHDPLARSALIGYASAALEQGRTQLFQDLIEWVGECETRDRHKDLMTELDQIREHRGTMAQYLDADDKREDGES